MLNKEEIVFNCRSLVDTWLSDIKDVSDVWIEMCGNGMSDTHKCTLENCGEVIGGLLYDNNGKYDRLDFYGKVNGVKKNIGSIDII